MISIDVIVSSNTVEYSDELQSIYVKWMQDNLGKIYTDAKIHVEVVNGQDSSQINVHDDACEISHEEVGVHIKNLDDEFSKQLPRLLVNAQW